MILRFGRNSWIAAPSDVVDVRRAPDNASMLHIVLRDGRRLPVDGIRDEAALRLAIGLPARTEELYFDEALGLLGRDVRGFFRLLRSDVTRVQRHGLTFYLRSELEALRARR